MDAVVYLLLLALSGLIVGGLGRLALPGPDPIGILATIAVGVAGSFVAGLIVWAIAGEPHGAGLLLSVLCATAIVYLIRRSRGGTLKEPAPYPPERAP